MVGHKKKEKDSRKEDQGGGGGGGTRRTEQLEREREVYIRAPEHIR